MQVHIHVPSRTSYTYNVYMYVHVSLCLEKLVLEWTWNVGWVVFSVPYYMYSDWSFDIIYTCSLIIIEQTHFEGDYDSFILHIFCGVACLLWSTVKFCSVVTIIHIHVLCLYFIAETSFDSGKDFIEMCQELALCN